MNAHAFPLASLALCLTAALQLPLSASLEAAGGRRALVIGNGAYVNAMPLANPVNDSRDMAQRLSEGGWEVSAVENAGVKTMLRSLREFSESSRGADAVMVFYAGHGLEVNGRNYLLPVDAVLAEADGVDALPAETIALDKMLADLSESGARLKVVVLDACRNNPISRSWLSRRSGGGGMADVSDRALPEGTMLVFSTAPGKVALDGSGRNSPFTSALLKRLKYDGGVANVFGDVALTMEVGQEAWIRFDGSGRSFSAFQALPFIKGATVQPLRSEDTQGNAASHHAAALELVSMFESPEMMETAFLSTMEPHISTLREQGFPEKAVGEVREAVLKWYNKTMDWDIVAPRMAELYTRAFTEGELREMVDFFKSPIGQKYISKSPILLEQATKLGQTLGEENQAELEQEMVAILSQYTPGSASTPETAPKPNRVYDPF